MKIKLFCVLFLLFSTKLAYASYDKRGAARFSIGLETGYAAENLSMNYKNDNLIELDNGFDHTSLYEEAWDSVSVWKNKLSLNVPLFKIGSGDLILQGFGAYGDSFSGDYKLTQRFDPVDKEAAGYEYLYRNYKFSDIDYKSYDFSLNFAYQIAITPDGRQNRDYYIFSSKVHSFLLPKIGYAHYTQDHALSGSLDFGQVENYSDSYTTSWSGPFIGVESLNFISDNHKVSVGANLYYIDYQILGDIGSDQAFLTSAGLTDPAFDAFFLRPNNSMEADGTGSGYSVNVGYSYQPGNHLSYDVNVNYTSTRMKSGDATYYFKDNSSFDDKINEANWDSFLLSLGLTYNF